MDWAATGMLDGLEGEAREARGRLLDELHGRGVSVEELERACEEDRLMLVPIELALFAPARYTAGQAAEAAGLSLDLFLRVRRAWGLSVPAPDEVAYTDDDVEAARRIRTYLDLGFPTEEFLGTARVIGSSLNRTAEVARAIFATSLVEPGMGEDEIAARFGRYAEELMPSLDADVAHITRLHLRQFARQDAISMAQLQSGRVRWEGEFAVGFADIVGFTALGEEVDIEVLGDVAERLLAHTEEVVEPPVRVVKTIGDAVMLVAPEPEPLLAEVLDLMGAAEADEELPPLRGGVAYGPAVQRFGDFYGTTVNVAARLCQRARPGSVLTSAEVHDALPDTFAWSLAGPKRLKGIAAPVDTWRARRLAA